MACGSGSEAYRLLRLSFQVLSTAIHKDYWATHSVPQGPLKPAEVSHSVAMIQG